MPVFGDEVGMFWEEQVIESSRSKGKKEDWNPNATAKANYNPPKELIAFRSFGRVGLDIEAYDPNLLTMGSGAHRKDGRIVGIAIADSIGHSTYYPTAHVNKDRCVANPDKFWANFREQASNYEGEIVGANLVYDLDWLMAEQGVTFPKAKIRDVQTAEPLIDENRLSYKLEVLARHYLEEGKLTEDLSSIYGKDFIKHMDMVDPGHAADYAERDTTLPWEILDQQQPILADQNLTPLFEMESRLTPLLIQMRQCGVRIDVEKAEEAYNWMQDESRKAAESITHLTGIHVDVWSGQSIAHAFDELEIPYPKTSKGNPSFRKEWLENHSSDLARLIVEQRGYDKIGGTFIKNYLLEGHINGRIHCNFNQLRSDNYGTVSGRFSSSNPNLQNIPARHPVMGPLLRSIFIPEDDHQWGSADWSQIEYRFCVHYAHLTPRIDASVAVEMYRNDANTDFHALAAEITGVDRKKAKNINFGVVYGMGVATMAAYLGCTMDEAETMLNTFHSQMPFLKGIYDIATRRAAQKGYIATILGRRRRFNTWEYGNKLYQSKDDALLAKMENPSRYSVRRAQTHKALNALLQGSAADLMKQAMVEMYEAGLFDVLVPHITVHDEMDVSVPNTPLGLEAFKEMQHIMETSMTLAVPIFADAALGANWNEAK